MKDIPDRPDAGGSIFDDMELGTWPTTRAVTQDPLDKVFERLEAGCHYQYDLLKGSSGRKGKTRGRQWWVEEPDGTFSCRIEVSGKTVVLKDGQTTAKFRSREGAMGFYEKIVEWIGTGELDELVKKHRASIPRRRRTP